MSHKTSERGVSIHSGDHISLPELEKVLPKTLGKSHSFRHGASTLYYRRWKPFKRQGYHFVVVCSALITGIVFLINFISTLVIAQKNGILHGLVILQSGDCKKTKHMSLWLHLLINLLGTLLLGASNYCMQCLSSPTRKEIDEAHRRNTWLDIGVPSLRNLRSLSWTRILLWGLLGFSSLPLHWIYNSAIFVTFSYQEFMAFVVGENFLTGADYHIPSVLDKPWNLVFSDVPYQYVEPGNPQPYSHIDSEDIPAQLQLLRHAPRLERLENKECIKAYSALIVSDRGSVLLVSSYHNSTNSLLGIEGGHTYSFKDNIYPNTWIAEGFTDYTGNIDAADAKTWTYGTSRQYPILYCLSTKFEDRCELQVSVIIMAIIITCNFVKLVCMTTMAWRRNDQPLVTLGDAIESFLNETDPTTYGLCLSERTRFLRTQDWRLPPIKYNPEPRRWFGAASQRRWYISNVLGFLTLISAISLLSCSASVLGSNESTWNLSLDSATPYTILHLNGAQASVFTMALLANTPQLLLSYIYFVHNSLYTCMLLAKEWSGYAWERKSLRVTSPVGKQRSTYRLQIPYRYGIPLLILSGVLHWLASQSIFLVRINAYDYRGEAHPQNNISTCGYSFNATVVTAVLISMVTLLGYVNGYRRYKPGIPLVESCSAAISAACHPFEGDKNASISNLL